MRLDEKLKHLEIMRPECPLWLREGEVKEVKYMHCTLTTECQCMAVLYKHLVSVSSVHIKAL